MKPNLDIFAVVGLLFMTGPALYFFLFLREKDSNLSPAESREMNQPCLWLNFYDA